MVGKAVFYLPSIAYELAELGHTIKRVLQGPVEEMDHFSACAVYIELSDGVVLELTADGPEQLSGIPSNAVLAQIQGPMGSDLEYAGDTVAAIVQSPYWPSIGLRLASERLLYTSDRYTPFHVRACLDKVGHQFGEEDVAPFVSE